MRILVDEERPHHLTGKKRVARDAPTTPVCSFKNASTQNERACLEAPGCFGWHSAAIVIEHKKPNCRRKIAVLTLRLNRMNKVRQGHQTPAPDLL